MPRLKMMLPETRLDREDTAYGDRGSVFGRRGTAIVVRNKFNPIPDLPYGEIRPIRAGIPDTFFSIPARLRFRGRTVKGFLTVQGNSKGHAYLFTPEIDAK